MCIIHLLYAHCKFPRYPPALAAERIYKARAEICHPFTPTVTDKWGEVYRLQIVFTDCTLHSTARMYTVWTVYPALTNSYISYHNARHLGLAPETARCQLTSLVMSKKT